MMTRLSFGFMYWAYSSGEMSIGPSLAITHKKFVIFETNT